MPGTANSTALTVQPLAQLYGAERGGFGRVSADRTTYNPNVPGGRKVLSVKLAPATIEVLHATQRGPSTEAAAQLDEWAVGERARLLAIATDDALKCLLAEAIATGDGLCMSLCREARGGYEYARLRCGAILDGREAEVCAECVAITDDLAASGFT